ncbi:MAG: T9SS type A sorting domain-containing protein [Candidatus Kapaibacterium sp.]
MKSLILLMLALLLLSDTHGTAQQNDFALKVDKDTVTITEGETATFEVSFVIQNGYDASIFLALTTGTLQMQYSKATLPSLVNAPYSPVKLTITTTPLYTKGGVYELRITGSNGSLSNVARCYMKVIDTSYQAPIDSSKWHIITKPTVGFPKIILQDSKGNYWNDMNGVHIEGKNTVLEKWGGGAMYNYGSISVPPIIDTKNSIVWIPTYYEGLYRYSFDMKSKTQYTAKLPDKHITALALDTTKNTLWIGTEKGLARLSGDLLTIYDSTNSILSSELITEIVFYGSTVWIGTSKGLVKYEAGKWSRHIIPQDSGFAFSRIHRLAVEKNGDLWMGLSRTPSSSGNEPYLMEGFAKFNGVTWTFYNSSNSPLHKSNYVNSIAIDQKGNKWLASASHYIGDSKPIGGVGILKFDNTNWTVYNTLNSPLPGNIINWVGLDNEDNVWFHQLIMWGSSIYDNSFWGVFNETGLPPLIAPVSVDDQEISVAAISIFPSPASATITITGGSIAPVKILNSLGIEVAIGRESVAANDAQVIDVSTLASGVYFAQCRTANGVVTKPFVVAR